MALPPVVFILPKWYCVVLHEEQHIWSLWDFNSIETSYYFLHLLVQNTALLMILCAYDYVVLSVIALEEIDLIAKL